METELYEVNERLEITQDRIDGGSHTYARVELLDELRQGLRDRAVQLKQRLYTPKPVPTPPVPPSPKPPPPPPPPTPPLHVLYY